MTPQVLLAILFAFLAGCACGAATLIVIASCFASKDTNEND